MPSLSLALAVLLLPTTAGQGELAAGSQVPGAAFYALPDVAPRPGGPGEVDFREPAGLRTLIEHFRADLRALRRFWDVDASEERAAREREFLEAWDASLAALPFEALDVDERIDWHLLRVEIETELRRLATERSRRSETRALLPFAQEIARLQEARRRLERSDPRRSAALLGELAERVGELSERVQRTPEEGDGEEEAGGKAEDERERGAEDAFDDAIAVEPLVANRAASRVRSLREALGRWFRYYDGYDPLFSWWCRAPFEELDAALVDFARQLREEVAGVREDDTDTILGDPIGRDALLSELAGEWIAYTPEQLIEIAEREFAWCDARLLEASRELGHGDDWRAALESVKQAHVDPGEQPRLIRELHEQSVAFLERNELVSVPPFASNVWRMEMMSPERQKYTPYFTGGEVISVSFPTDGMAHADKLMSMRGNNEHFSRATVHHELIPGHHLQQYMNSRYRPYRRAFGTPFWTEGWALYWEMLLWDLGFARSAADRVGMLFWRRHRCARIVFSLRFHLGEMTPEECIDYLVERVGHERNNATAEVRRSVQGGYGPLYQAAYMVGGLQFRALHAELVGSGRMTNRAFHDAVLREGPIPVELVRAKLSGLPLERDFRAAWRF